MAKVTLQYFVGSRTRAVQIGNDSQISGWVESFYGTTLEVGTSVAIMSQKGDRFRFELNCKRVSAVFDATLTDLHPSSFKVGRTSTFSSGANALEVESKFWTMQFAVEGKFQLMNSSQEVRRRKEGVTATLIHEGAHQKGEVLDASIFGFACHLPCELPQGALVKFDIRTQIGPVEGQGTVQFCRKFGEARYRTGVRIWDLGRLDLHRWARFVEGD